MKPTLKERIPVYGVILYTKRFNSIDKPTDSDYIAHENFLKYHIVVATILAALLILI